MGKYCDESSASNYKTIVADLAWLITITEFAWHYFSNYLCYDILRPNWIRLFPRVIGHLIPTIIVFDIVLIAIRKWHLERNSTIRVTISNYKLNMNSNVRYHPIKLNAIVTWCRLHFQFCNYRLHFFQHWNLKSKMSPHIIESSTTYQRKQKWVVMEMVNTAYTWSNLFNHAFGDLYQTEQNQCDLCRLYRLTIVQKCIVYISVTSNPRLGNYLLLDGEVAFPIRHILRLPHCLVRMSSYKWSDIHSCLDVPAEGWDRILPNGSPAELCTKFLHVGRPMSSQINIKWILHASSAFHFNAIATCWIAINWYGDLVKYCASTLSAVGVQFIYTIYIRAIRLVGL